MSDVSDVAVDDGSGRVVDIARLIAHLRERGETVGAAESLTGGLVAAALTHVGGSSVVFRGGIVAYHSDLKSSLLGVDADLLAAGGAVQAEVARQLARGVRDRTHATWGVGTTGAAGPEPSDGKAVGTVFVAVDADGVSQVRELSLRGDRTAIRRAAVAAALRLLGDCAGMPS